MKQERFKARMALTANEWYRKEKELKKEKPWSVKLPEIIKKTAYTTLLVASMGFAGWEYQQFSKILHLAEETQAVMETEGFKAGVKATQSGARLYGHLRDDKALLNGVKGYILLRAKGDEELAKDLETFIADYERFEERKGYLTLRLEGLYGEAMHLVTSSEKAHQQQRYTP